MPRNRHGWTENADFICSGMIIRLLCLVAIIMMAVYALGCSGVEYHTVLRGEYNGNLAVLQGSDPIDSHLFLGLVGPELDIPIDSTTMRVAVLAGPALFSDEEESRGGVNVAPRILWFLSQDTFVHVETDVTFYPERGDQNVFFFGAIETRF